MGAIGGCPGIPSFPEEKAPVIGDWLTALFKCSWRWLESALLDQERAHRCDRVHTALDATAPWNARLGRSERPHWPRGTPALPIDDLLLALGRELTLIGTPRPASRPLRTRHGSLFWCFRAPFPRLVTPSAYRRTES